MNPLLELEKFGQSYWLDNLTRGMIQSGELKNRVEKEGLRGVTSNPSIFNKAISKSSDYDRQIRELVERGLGIGEIYDAVVIEDIQNACDVLRPVYDQSKGQDGFVSLEVSPYLAHDTSGSMDEARKLFQAVDRPNLFIKIPGTPAGVPAIEEMLFEGININITLLFSIKGYEAVARAYIKALERRVQKRKSIRKVASVASFFLSRIDVLVDQLLSHRILDEGEEQRKLARQLMGEAAVANAKLAYQSFLKIINSDRWKALEKKGAMVQRMLWASTSTKDPLYRDVRYVEPLVGPHTVNTMPEETITAVADHAEIQADTIEADLPHARKVFRELRKVGIDLNQVTEQLQSEGVQKFISPFDELMKTLAEKRHQFLGKGRNRQSIRMNGSVSSLKSAFESLDQKQFSRRLFSRDTLLWGPSTPENLRSISNRLGWLESVETFQEQSGQLTRFANKIKKDGFKDVLLLGMGGSSLCPEVCSRIFGSSRGWPRLQVLDSTDPESIQALTAALNPRKTLFLVSSKSGTTVETMSFYKYFFEWVRSQTGSRPGRQFAAITDAGTPLVEEASRKKFRKCFENPSDIGGRYSALSYFGLVPMALIGMDIKALLDRARQALRDSGPLVPASSSPAVALGSALGLSARQGRDKVTFLLSEPILSFGDWVEQLLAESTGKQGTGLVPIVGEVPATPENYSSDRLFVYLNYTRADNGTLEKRLSSLEKQDQPVIQIDMSDKQGLSEEFIRWEIATATAGSVLGINPFDEPNVAESKENTSRLLQDWNAKGDFSEGRPLAQSNGISLYVDSTQKWLWKKKADSQEILRQFIQLAEPPDYFTLLAYFTPTASRTGRLHKIRSRVRDQQKVATCLGFGPRYLHSTGQLHKGGANRGVFLILTSDPGEDVNIPEETYTFGVLQKAQALGDQQALQNKQRRVMRVHLGSNVDQGLKSLLSFI